LTELISEPDSMANATWSLPSSRFNKANRADASRTDLLTFGVATSLGDELVYQGTVRGHVPRDEVLRSLDRLLGAQNPNFSVLETQNHLITLLDSKRPAIFHRNNDSSTSRDSCSHCLHVPLLQNVPLLTLLTLPGSYGTSLEKANSAAERNNNSRRFVPHCDDVASDNMTSRAGSGIIESKPLGNLGS